MADDLRSFGTADLAHFKVHAVTGELYWRGQRLRRGGWSRAEKISFWAIIAGAVVTLIVNVPNLVRLWAVVQDAQG